MATLQVQPINLAGQVAVSATLAPVPDECPICHHKISPIHRLSFSDPNFPVPKLSLQAAFQCPRAECYSLFIAYYEFRSNTPITSQVNNVRYELLRTAPASFRQVTFPPEITKISPEFARIYNQAAAAESANLADVAGPGYGKALEFLIKDYLISRNQTEAEGIKKEFLATAIKNRVDDQRIKSVAERAAWLRNDETHYERRWEAQDMQSLKDTISLAVHWIDSSLLTEKLLNEMPAPKK